MTLSEANSTGEYLFKTVYFPGARVRKGASARVVVGIPIKNGMAAEFLTFATQLSSRDFRMSIGDPFVEDLEAQAQDQGMSFSDVCLRRLQESYSQNLAPSRGGHATNGQLRLPFGASDGENEPAEETPTLAVGVTFQDSLRQGAFGWYPYVEGFSATYTRDAILRYKPKTVYDPFGGSGTTQLAAASLGIPSFYSEINPFMCFVADTKVLAAQWARSNQSEFEKACSTFGRYLSSASFQRDAARIDLSAYEAAFPDRDFFQEADIRQLLAAIAHARRLGAREAALRDLLLLACVSNAVRSSNMTRRADLRRRRADEYKSRVVNVPAYIADTLARFVRDIQQLPRTMARSVRVCEDARTLPTTYSNAFDFALTSPPYLNGTNYFRNTKIELWLLGFIESEKELADYCRRAIAAGINNVTRDREATHRFDRVEEVVADLAATDGDKRISLLVRQYFSDMHELFVAVCRGLTPGGTFLLDIGDSKFYGVHVPTDRLLVDAAARAGLTLEHRHILAHRYSRDKSSLVQVELVFKKQNNRSHRTPKTVPRGGGDLEGQIAAFQKALGYKEPPFDKRNWGHPLHSLCSYQGKLKPAMAHWIIRTFVPDRGRVLDPLGGVGTIPFEAALLGHQAVSNDKSPFPALVARAKLAPPPSAKVHAALDRWWGAVESIRKDDLDFRAAEFGLNGTVSDFYHPRTLEEILQARSLFLSRPPRSDADAFIWASLLHVLHGNRPYALSRTSHPITPFHPRGPATYRSLKEKVTRRVEAALEFPLPAQFTRGLGLQGDFRELSPKAIGAFDAVVTSPPFLGMRFDRPNWLRLWFCGWGEGDFHRTSLDFLERQQTRSPEVYRTFFTHMHSLVKPTGVLIIHMGSGRHDKLVDALRTLGNDVFRLRGEVDENVQAVEQHGIRDKGRTTHHHLLFFTPRG